MIANSEDPDYEIKSHMELSVLFVVKDLIKK